MNVILYMDLFHAARGCLHFLLTCGSKGYLQRSPKSHTVFVNRTLEMYAIKVQCLNTVNFMRRYWILMAVYWIATSRNMVSGYLEN
jgi:hypothetical protein